MDLLRVIDEICLDLWTVEYTHITKSLINTKHIQQSNNLQNLLNFTHKIIKHNITTQIILNNSSNNILILYDNFKF